MKNHEGRSHIFPEIYPDETLYSLLARIAILNGGDHLQAIGLLLGKGHPTSVIGCPVNIVHFCEITNGVYGEPKDLLCRLTVLPLLVDLGVLVTSTLFDVESGNLRPELDSMVFGTTRGCSWRICSECMDRDSRTYGVAYWHRAHQLPTTQYCVEHGALLNSYSLRRKDLHEQLVMPTRLSSRIRNLEEVTRRLPGKPWRELSELGQEALIGHQTHFSRRVVRAAIIAGLKQRLLLTASGKVDFPSYELEFRRKYSVDSSGTAASFQSRMANPRRLLDGIVDNSICDRFARLLLVDFLFSGWKAFKEQCKWQEALDVDLNHTGIGSEACTSRAVLFEDMLWQQRTICLEYKSSHDHPSRLEFMRKMYRSFRWLRANDSVWLNAELPVLSRTRRQRLLFINEGD